MNIMLKNVLANPFRDMTRYPINKQKILALKQSIEDTDFWDNILCRKVGDKVEIAYGHHRLTALRELFPDTHKINLIVRDLSDEDMLKIMAHENLEEWGHVSDIERETIRAVVQAFADNKIALAMPPRTTDTNRLRYAPSYCYAGEGISSSGSDELPYTADTIASFLGWQSTHVKYVLRALCMIEQGHLKEVQLQGLSRNAARTVVEETTVAVKRGAAITKQAERDARKAATPEQAKVVTKVAKEQAKKIITTTAKAVSDEIKTPGSGQQAARDKAREARTKLAPEQELPGIEKMASSIARAVRTYLDSDSGMGHKLTEILKYKAHLGSSATNDLVVALDVLIEDAEGYRAQLKKSNLTVVN